MSAFPGVSSYQSSSLGSKFVVIGVVCCQEMRRNALFHKVLPVLTKYFTRNNASTLPTLEAVCRAFGITPAQFFSDEVAPAQLTDEQRTLFARWSSLTERQKRLLLGLMEII